MLTLCSYSCIVFVSVVLRLLLSNPLIKLIYEYTGFYAKPSDGSSMDANSLELLFERLHFYLQIRITSRRILF
jgi:hypothetical protein